MLSFFSSAHYYHAVQQYIPTSNTWCGLAAVRSAPPPIRRPSAVVDTYLEIFDKIADQGCCSCCDVEGHCGLIRNEFQKYVKLQFVFLSLNTLL